MMHTPEFYDQFRRKKYCIALHSNGLDDVKTGFDTNVLNNMEWRSIPYSQVKENDKRDVQEVLAEAEEDNSPIECLITTVKANMTVPALKDIRHRLTSDSTVCLLQNGMGMIEMLNKEVFPDPDKRPSYIRGIISHGLYRRQALYAVEHAGVGTTILSPVSSSDSPIPEADTDWAPTTKYLLRLLTLTPPLVAVAETPAGLLQYQLEKLAVNCVINPLTALSECKNGELLYSYSFTRVMRLLLFEISRVICALPELQGIPGIEDRFAPERLRRMAVQVMNKTSTNTSSMMQDIERGKTTEIEYLNGYIVRRGEELGIKCALNYMIKNLVMAKAGVRIRREQSAIPLDIRNMDDLSHVVEG